VGWKVVEKKGKLVGERRRKFRWAFDGLEVTLLIHLPEGI
jgi:hypothetical protein